MGRLGITVLSEGFIGGKGPVVDLVAVHGLNGDSHRTWTHKKNNKMWLKDFLPEDFPYARIMTFGYDANVRGTNSNGFRESSHRLLVQLQDIRHSQSNINVRPIVFICHSLGGIVVKSALHLATTNPSYADIRECTIATIFMGTPHRGSHAAPLGKIMSNIAQMLFMDVSSNHLNELLPGSRELQALSDNFCSILTNPRIDVVNFCETAMLKIGISGILIVPPYSAAMDPIDPVRMAISLYGDHRQICQFPARDDSEYLQVKAALLQICEARVKGFPYQNAPIPLPSSVSDQSLSSWLKTRTPIEEVAFTGTCTWIHGRPEFLEWQNASNSGLLWIYGPPGIGKTVLASYLTSIMRENSKGGVIHSVCKEESPSSSDISFLVSGVIGQYLRQSLLQEKTMSQIIELYKKYPNSSDIPFSELLAFFSDFLQSASSITLILDGMDEWDEALPEINQLLSLIIHECRRADSKVKVLLISRKTLSLQRILASQSSLSIRQDDTLPGILSYARERVRLMAHIEPYIREIDDTIVKRSGGLFLWVEQFMSGFENLRTENDVYEYINNTKDGLASMYHKILERLEVSSSGLADLRKRILTFEAVSFKSLELLELEEAVAVRHGLLKIEFHDRMLGGWDTLQAACGPLLQCVNEKVELVHLSARAFILDSTERVAFPSLPRSSQEAHQDITAVCLTYLCFNALKGSFTGDSVKDCLRQKNHPLLKYATLYWADHLINSGPLPSFLLDLLERFIVTISGTTWAVSYFPYFKHLAGENLMSAFGLLQTRIAQVKVSVRRSWEIGSSPAQKEKILRNLDVFLVRSFENAVSLETHENGPTARDTMERRLDLSKVYQITRDLNRAEQEAFETHALASSTAVRDDSLILRCKHQMVLVAMDVELNKEKGSFEKIASSFQKLLSPLEQTLGAFHIDTLRCRHDVGLTLTYNGQYLEGLQILREVLTQMQEHLGQTSTITQRAANNVASTLYSIDMYDQVEDALSTIPEVRSVIRPTPTVEIEMCHPFTFDSLSILALNLLMQGEFDRSIVMHKRAMRGREALFGQGDTVLLTFARNVGLAFEGQGRYETAVEHYKKWLAVAQKHKLETKVRHLQNALADCYRRWAEAVERGEHMEKIPEVSFTARIHHWAVTYTVGQVPLIYGLAGLVSLIFSLQIIWRILAI